MFVVEDTRNNEKEAEGQILTIKDVTFIISLNNNVTDLSLIIQLFEKEGAVVGHLETRPKLTNSIEDGSLELYTRVKLESDRLDSLVAALRAISTSVLVHTEDSGPESMESINKASTNDPLRIPWFPQHISELDEISNHVFMYGSDLDADHPSFKDEEYRKRRNMFTEIAINYRHGQPIPRIEYTQREKETWCCIYLQLIKLYETHACKEHLGNLKLLQEHAGYRESDLPQLEDVSKFLKIRTGFTLRPVAGYLSARDFLAGLAYRVFYCTQYIRHGDDPMYTPEPDCCHELLGHAPMLADPIFARLSQEIGLASLGTTEEEVKKLATCYFFTIEFGLCRQNGQLRAYGAGLLSSIAELKHALTDTASVKPFVPAEVMKMQCLVTTFQNGYFETSSFEEATEKMRDFAKTIQRPFDVVYDPYTQRVRLLDGLEGLSELLRAMKMDMSLLIRSAEKMNENMERKKSARYVLEQSEQKRWKAKGNSKVAEGDAE